MEDNCKKLARDILNKALPLIAAGKRKYSGAAMVMAPIFTSENIAEGYIQRVKAIDDEILCDSYNVYIDLETKNQHPTLTQVDERHLFITFNPHNKTYVRAIITLAKGCGVLYTHSVMRAMPDIVGYEIFRLYRTRKILKIWDVHGSVPEEFALSDNYYEAQNAGEAEELFIECSHRIITVNCAMKRHLEQKYNRVLDNVTVLPIFGTEPENARELPKQKQGFDTPTAVYAGGLQPWQNIPLLQSTIKQALTHCRYKIFVPDSQEFCRLWKDSPLPPSLEVSSKSPQEVLEQYRFCHYGFVLRDDITVNNVACPTKLIEYLQYAVVPILKTENIGDFSLLGMKYITYQEFLASPPTSEQYAEMSRENFNVLSKLKDMHDRGRAELEDIIHEKLNF
ncbi:MAG: hypothetical protein RR846_04645 [Oscillospiraceae bacterium]